MAQEYGPKVVTDGLVLCLDAADKVSYPGSGATWYDLSGNGNDGTINGATYSNNEFSFDGTNDHVVTTTNVLPNSTDITIDQWILFDSSIVYGGPFGYGKIGGIATFGFLLHSTGASGLYALVSDGTTQSQAVSIGGLVDQTIYNLTWIIRENGLVTIYKNGVYNNQGGSRVPQFDSSFFIIYGLDVRYSNGSSGRNWPGSIYCTRVYNRTLTTSEVLQNFNAHRSRFSI